ncbi:Pex12 amino terminal region-domain-containing protein [Scheffersomyces amazonensis]|uniref:Pex12 amino terminal region-domain-containing protein n=1 Tax=Scheffersomyces amazonensis TaxID=1078765 RepID=UPI00315C97DF
MIPISYPSPRVSQLDAHILDAELITLLKEQLTSIFQLHTTSRFSYNEHPELWSLLLNLIIFKQTVWKSGSSYGLSLQNLKLSDSRTGKLIGFPKRYLLLGLLIGDYLFSKLQTYIYSNDEVSNSGHRYNTSILEKFKSFIISHRSTVLTSLDKLFKVLNLINFMLFLINGKYPSLIHRIFGITMTPIVSDLLKFNGNNVNFEFQNRQLVWNVMTEFLVFILPLLQLSKFKRLFKSAFSNNYIKDSDGSSSSSGPFLLPYANLPLSQCAICHNNNHKAEATGGRTFISAGTITNPYVTNCGHVYCYICISTAFNAIKVSGEELKCLRCGEKVENYREYGNDNEVNDGDEFDQDAIVFEGEWEENEEEEEDDDNEVVSYDVDDHKAMGGKLSKIDSSRLPLIETASEDDEQSDGPEYSEEEDFDEDEALDL